MTTKPDIKVKREEAKKLAGDLRAQAEVLKQTVTKIQTYRVEHIQDKWSDAVSKRYFKQMKLNTTSLEEQISYLEEIAGGIEREAAMLTEE